MGLFRWLDRLFWQSDWPFWLVGLLYPATIWLTLHSILDTASIRDIMEPARPAMLFQHRDGIGAGGEAHAFRTKIHLGRGNSWSR